MSLATNISTLITRIGTEFKSVRSSIGTLANLTTTSKTDVVSAINEVKQGQAQAGAQINDTTAGTGTVYSSSKTNSQITNATAQVKSDILGGASAAYDTLLELQNAFTGDQSQITNLTTLVGQKVDFTVAQTLTSGQKAQALTNIGAAASADVGDTTTDFVSLFNAAIA